MQNVICVAVLVSRLMRHSVITNNDVIRNLDAAQYELYFSLYSLLAGVVMRGSPQPVTTLPVSKVRFMLTNY